MVTCKKEACFICSMRTWVHSGTNTLEQLLSALTSGGCGKESTGPGNPLGSRILYVPPPPPRVPGFFMQLDSAMPLRIRIISCPVFLWHHNEKTIYSIIRVSYFVYSPIAPPMLSSIYLSTLLIHLLSTGLFLCILHEAPLDGYLVITLISRWESWGWLTLSCRVNRWWTWSCIQESLMLQSSALASLFPVISASQIRWRHCAVSVHTNPSPPGSWWYLLWPGQASKRGPLSP